jgi:hypothetical protein
MRYERPTEIYRGKPVSCSRCGALIGFVQNRNGKWFPVDLHGDGVHDYLVYDAHYGNHNNYIKWHSCNKESQFYPYYDMRNEITIFDHYLFDTWMNEYRLQIDNPLSDKEWDQLPRLIKDILIVNHGWMFEK